MVINLFAVSDKQDAKLFRLPSWLVIVVFYLSCCFASIHDTGATLMSLPNLLQSFNFDIGNSVELGGWIYLLGGVGSLIWFELLSRVYFSVLRVNHLPHLEPKRFRHTLRFFFIGKNIVMGGLNLLALYFPVYITIGSILIDFLVTTAACVAFYVYYSGVHLPDFLKGRCLIMFASPYFTFSAIYFVINMMYGFMGGAL